MVELIIALVAAGLGSVVTWALSRGDSKKLAEAQQQTAAAQLEIAHIERERSDWEQRYRQQLGLNITGRILGTLPEPQAIQVNANEEMDPIRIDYCIDTGARIVTDDVSGAPRGRELHLPISSDHVRELQRIKYNARDGSADIRFRILVRVLGTDREIDVPARLVDRQIGNRSYLGVVG